MPASDVRTSAHQAIPEAPHANGGAPEAGAGPGSAVRSDGVAARLRRLRLPFSGNGNGKKGAPPAFAEEPSPEGLQELIKGTEVWFGIEASAVERQASELAKAAAAANLPRVEVQYAEVAEESELAAQCRAVFHGWIQRVVARVRDAVQSSARAAATGLKQYEQAIGGLENAVAELPVRRHELRDAEAEAEAGQAQIEFTPLISRWHYAALIVLLVVVDWIANVPVFAELLPKDPGSEETWRVLAARSETMGLFGGVYRVAARALHHIDASLLAAGLIIALVWLAHAFGDSLRRLVTHSAAEHPTAGLTIRGQRRQSWFPTVVAGAGLALIVTVLWLARAQLETTTQLRLAETQAHSERVQTELEAARSAQDLARIGALEQEATALETQRAQRLERADYASMISGMNRPILFLNIVLALTAAIAAYLRTSGTVRGAVVNPRVAALRHRIAELMLQAGERRNAMARSDTAVDGHFARLQYLAALDPLHGWEAKAYRLQAVIPSFRAENARLRGIDVANIAAFARPVELGLTVAHAPVGTDMVPELEQYRALRAALRQRADAALARMDVVMSAPDARS